MLNLYCDRDVKRRALVTMERLMISNLFSGRGMTASAIPNKKAYETFASILSASVKKSVPSGRTSPFVKAQPRIGSLEETDSLSETELEDKYCSMCGSRIKEDGTCPICIVPVFISGNPGSRSLGISPSGTIQASAGNRITASYRRRR